MVNFAHVGMLVLIDIKFYKYFIIIVIKFFLPTLLVQTPCVEITKALFNFGKCLVHFVIELQLLVLINQYYIVVNQI
jgi:hypothetical protein